MDIAIDNKHRDTKGVHRANRQDLHQLLAFIENKLPHRHDLINLVLGALSWLSSPSALLVYFTRDNTHAQDEFSAFVAFNVDRMNIQSDDRPTTQTEKCWHSSAWCSNKEALYRIYDSLDCINWVEDFFSIHMLDPEAVPNNISDHLFIKKGLKLDKRSALCYKIERQSALELQIEEVENAYTKSLERCHAQLVHEYWPYNIFATVEDVANAIQNFPSAGVFLKENDQLVSWMIHHPPWGMGMLNTLKEHRRKGYAALVSKYLTKRMAQAGYVPYVIIDIGNEASISLFESIGFRFVRELNNLISTIPPSVLEGVQKNFSAPK